MANKTWIPTKPYFTMTLKDAYTAWELGNFVEAELNVDTYSEGTTLRVVDRTQGGRAIDRKEIFAVAKRASLRLDAIQHVTLPG